MQTLKYSMSSELNIAGQWEATLLSFRHVTLHSRPPSPAAHVKLRVCPLHGQGPSVPSLPSLSLAYGSAGGRRRRRLHPVVAGGCLCKAPHRKWGQSCGLVPLAFPDRHMIPRAREIGVVCFGIGIKLVIEYGGWCPAKKQGLGLGRSVLLH